MIRNPYVYLTVLLCIILNTPSVFCQNNLTFKPAFTYPKTWFEQNITPRNPKTKLLTRGVLGEFFKENFNGGIPSTWSRTGKNAQFESCALGCMLGFESKGFIQSILLNDGNPNGPIPNSTLTSGTAAITMTKQSNLDATLTTSAINCAGKNKVTLQFSALYWGGANSDAEKATGNANQTCFLRVSNDGTTWKSYPIFESGLREMKTVIQDISSVAANKSTVYIQFLRTGDENNGIWLIDELSLTDIGSSSTYNTTLYVDMSKEKISTKGVYIAHDNGNGNWTPNAVKMDSMGGGLYRGVIAAMPQSTVVRYKFMNGNSWGENEGVPKGCGTLNTWGSYDRVFVVGKADTEIPPMCFGACISCGDRKPQSAYEYCPKGNEVIYCDNFENYSTNKLIPQSTRWTTFDLLNGVSLSQAKGNPNVTSFWEGYTNYDGSKSLRIFTDYVKGEVDNPIAFMGNPTEGSYQLDFKMYVPTGGLASFSTYSLRSTPSDTTLINGIGFSISDSLRVTTGLDIANTKLVRDGKSLKFNNNVWNNMSLSFNAKTNHIILKMNGTTLFDKVNTLQLGFSFFGLTALDLLSPTPPSTQSAFLIDNIVYRIIPNDAALKGEDILGLSKKVGINPNPADDRLTITPEASMQIDWQVRMYNSVGQIIEVRQGSGASSLDINTKQYTNGIYIVEFVSENERWSKKVVVKH